MIQEELSACSEDKIKKICSDFNLLNEDQQDYILGIMQALLFAKNTANSKELPPQEYNPGESENNENNPDLTGDLL